MNTSPAFILQEIKSIEKILEKYCQTGSIPKIERDLTLTKLQSIYDSVLNIGEHENKHTAIILEDEPIVASEKKEEKPSDDYIEFVLPEIKHEKSIIKPVEIQQKDEIHIIESQLHKDILAEKIVKKTIPLNEVISGTTSKKDISSLLQAKGIKDIESAIDINDRFLFVRELFSGDAVSFQKTIQILNNSSNFNEAFNYIHNTYSWDLDAEPTLKLLDLVRRRFIIEE
jgi:hypothetical protein